MAQVVTAENFSQLIETGKVDEFKPPEAEIKAEPEKEPAKEVAKADEKKIDEKVDKNSEDSETGLTLSDAELTERAQKRINHKHRQMRIAEEAVKGESAKRLQAEAERDELRKQLQAQKSGSQPAEEAKPNPKDFEDPFEYAAKLSEFNVNKALKAEKLEQQKARFEAAEKARTDSFNKLVAETKKTLPDWEDVVLGSELILLNDGMDFIRESEQGPRIAYFLCSHPEEVERLNSLSHTGRVRALAKLEDKFETPAPKTETKAPEPKPVPQSKAPAPIVPLEQKGAAVEKDPSQMTTQEYLEWRKRKTAERARAH